MKKIVTLTILALTVAIPTGHRTTAKNRRNSRDGVGRRRIIRTIFNMSHRVETIKRII